MVLGIAGLVLLLLQLYVGAVIALLLLATFELWRIRITRKARPEPDYIAMAVKHRVPALISSALSHGDFVSRVGIETATIIEEMAAQTRRATGALMESRVSEMAGEKAKSDLSNQVSLAITNALSQSFLLIESALRDGAPISGSVLARLRRNLSTIELLADEGSKLASAIPSHEQEGHEDILARLRSIRELEESLAEHPFKTDFEARPSPGVLIALDPEASEIDRFPHLANCLQILRRANRFQEIREAFRWEDFLFLGLTVVAINCLQDRGQRLLAVVAMFALRAGLGHLPGRKKAQRTNMAELFQRGAWKKANKLMAANQLSNSIGPEAAEKLEICACLAQRAMAASAELAVLKPGDPALYRDARKLISDSALDQFHRCFGVLSASLLVKVPPESGILQKLGDVEKNLEMLAEEAAALASAVQPPEASHLAAIRARLHANEELKH